MKWTLPDIDGKKRWEVDPCIVTCEKSEDINVIAINIAIAAVKETNSIGAGLGSLMSSLHEVVGDQLDTNALSDEIALELEATSAININYCGGECVKLSLKVVDPNTIHISVNSWIGRVDDSEWAPEHVPTETLTDLEHVLSIAQSMSK